MSEQYTPSDDPRFTAYALGELDAAERAEVERLLEQHPAGRGVVEQVRDIAGQLTRELQREPAVVLPAGTRAAIEAQAAVVTVSPRSTSWRRWSYTVTWVAASVAVTGGLLWLASNPPHSEMAQEFASAGRETASDWRRQLVVQSESRAHSEKETVFDMMAGDQGKTDRFANSPSGGGAGWGGAVAPQSVVVGASTGLAEGLQVQDGLRDSPASSQAGSRNYSVPTTTLGSATLHDGDALGDLGEKKLARPDNRTRNPAQKYGASTTPAGGPAPSDPAAAGLTRRSGDNLSVNKPAESLPQVHFEAGKPTSTAATAPPPAPAAGPAAALSVKSPAALGLQQPEQGRAAGQPQADDTRLKVGFRDAQGSGPNSKDKSLPRPTGNVADGEKGLSLAGRGGVDAKRESAEQSLERLDELQVLSRLKAIQDVEAKQKAEELYRRKFQQRVEAKPAPGTEAYEPIIENEFVVPYREQAVSTFSADVDTASYSNVRRFLTQGQWPPPNAVRVEELVNYFKYDDPQPAGERPFSVNLEVNGCPWEPTHKLVRIGLKGKEIHRDKRPPSNLVFLVDVSGSMADNNKLPLVKQGLELLTNQMTEGDRVAIVTYSDQAVRRLESTRGDRRQPILDTIASLRAGGSTNGAGGIQMAYQTAVSNLLKEGTNRVILCTDGDFNVGVSDDDQLVAMIKEKAKSGVFLSVFGFGMGNLKDAKLEKLADKGNGHYAYVDDLSEARKVFVDEMSGTLVTIAKDVKIQVEFNPGRVGAYRLIGYENRSLAAQDFADDTKDAGEIGAGHSVTALYEVIPAEKAPKPEVAGLKYQKFAVPQIDPANNELLTLRLRYKQPDGDKSVQIDFELDDRGPEAKSRPSRDFEWSAAVAGFGLVLRDSQFKGQASLDLLTELALGSKGPDASGHRREFVDLIHRARVIQAREQGLPVPPTQTLPEKEAEAAATVAGKYRELLRKIEVPADAQAYGNFKEFGWWEGTNYAGQQDLPKGFWVYVHPHWYIWGATSQDK